MRQLEGGMRSLCCFLTDALTEVHIDSQVILTDRDLRGICEKWSPISNEVVHPVTELATDGWDGLKVQARDFRLSSYTLYCKDKLGKNQQ